ncbi:MAG: RidA family protein [Gammaproteobacteria bacterium]|nr:RidA family protein [Gammaproteobacteria bacterium]MBT8443695.1 RidA family protein [Gammaproteobacteria bacterium]NND36509.1 RidA family protein [Gammaproteobacteria bacterium]
MSTDAKRIQTEPDYYEPFRIAQAYRVGDLIMTSGQASLDKDGNIVGVGDFDAQAAQTFANLQELLQVAGSDLAKVVKVTVYLRDMNNFPKMLELRERYFTPPYPADTIVEVSSLALPELEIEIDAIALADGEVVA